MPAIGTHVKIQDIQRIGNQVPLHILGIFTIGILNLIFTNPYKAATDAELFRWLNGESLSRFQD